MIVRTEPAAVAKGKTRGAICSKIPREGSRLRRLYDILQASRGLPVILNWRTMNYPRNVYLANDIVQLRDYYGLDIRLLYHNGIPGKKGAGLSASTWLLAGEWLRREYVDYVAPRAADDRIPTVK